MDGAQITTEDKAIVRTGGLVFTSSPTASIRWNASPSLHGLLYLHQEVAWLPGVYNCSAKWQLWRTKTMKYGNDEADQTLWIL